MDRMNAIENRVRELEQAQAREAERTTRLEEQMKPLLTLTTAMTALSDRIGEMNAKFSKLEGKAVVVGVVATLFSSLVSSLACALVIKALTR